MEKNNNDEFISYVHANPQIYFKKARTSGYICPICGDGTGAKGTGITSKDKIHYSCWSRGCFRNADIFEIYMLENNLNSFADAIKGLKEVYHWIDTNVKFHGGKINKHKPVKKAEANYMEFYKQCNALLNQTDYLAQRGISLALANKFLLGYCPNWQHPTNEKSKPSDRLIIPRSKSSYLARSIHGDDNYSKMVVGVHLFNPIALNSGNPVFIVEGELDALSIMECGGYSTAICSTSNYKMLIEYIVKNGVTSPLILMMDNDSLGRACQDSLSKELDNLDIKYLRCKYKYKDPNEALVKDKEYLCRVVRIGIAKALDIDNVILQHKNLVYTAMLRSLKLEKKHLENLTVKRGMSLASVVNNGYRSTVKDKEDCSRVARQIMEAGITPNEAGFYKDDTGYKMVPLDSGFIIPFRNLEGKIQGCQIRYDEGNTRYVTLSSKKWTGGKIAKSQYHIACQRFVYNGKIYPKHNGVVAITEGALKADCIFDLYSQAYGLDKAIPVIAIAGVNCISVLEPVLRELKSQGVTIIYDLFDMDYIKNKEVQKAMQKLKNLIESLGLKYIRKDWDIEKGKGFDDYLLNVIRN